MSRASGRSLLLMWPWVALSAFASIFCLLVLQHAQPLTWDEIEFFRATRWISEGQVPYRDFWEHHTPLQWLVFAPVAGIFGGGAGAEAVLAMRWAQIPLWIGACVILLLLARRHQIEIAPRWLALLLLLTSRTFVVPAIQYRIDVLGNVAFLAGLALMASRRWVAFGVVMSAAALANMRLAPLIVAAAALALFWRADEERWRWNPSALRMIGGVLAVAGAFVVWLQLTGAWPGFIDGVIRYNTVSNRLAAPIAGRVFLPVLMAPLRVGDISGIALWMLAMAGSFFVLRDVKRASALKIVALLFIASVVLVGLTAVQYDYHLQTTWLLMVPLAAAAIGRAVASSPRAVPLAVTTVILATSINLAGLLAPGVGKGLEYQDLIMSEADRWTGPRETVWDGAGYALRRKPAYRYWFLAAGVRLMVQNGLIEPFDIVKDPPAAIIYNYRVHRWLLVFPEVRRYATHHYLPLYRNLMLPGMSAIVDARPTRTTWRVPKTAKYDVWASDLLAKHPWLARPLEYGMVEGPDAVIMRIPLARLPPFPYESLQWIVDGVPLPRGQRTLTLAKGSRVELISNVSRPTGVMLVLHGIETLAVAPEESFLF